MKKDTYNKILELISTFCFIIAFMLFMPFIFQFFHFLGFKLSVIDYVVTTISCFTAVILLYILIKLPYKKPIVKILLMYFVIFLITFILIFFDILPIIIAKILFGATVAFIVDGIFNLSLSLVKLFS